MFSVLKCTFGTWISCMGFEIQGRWGKQSSCRQGPAKSAYTKLDTSCFELSERLCQRPLYCKRDEYEAFRHSSNANLVLYTMLQWVDCCVNCLKWCFSPSKPTICEQLVTNRRLELEARRCVSVHHCHIYLPSSDGTPGTPYVL